MRFRIVWTPQATIELTDVWLNAANPAAVTAATNAIDALLAADPYAVGTHSFATVYECAHGPLGVEYEVDDANRSVSVLNVWETATGRPNPTGN